MSDSYNEILRKYILNYGQFVVPVKASWWPICIDFVLRIISLVLFKTGLFSFGQFIQQQVFIIPLVVVTFGIIRGRNTDKKISARLNISLFYGSPSFKMVIGILIAAIVSYFVMDNVTHDSFTWGRKTLYSLLFSFGYLVYQFIIIFLFSRTAVVDGEIKFFPPEKKSYYCLQVPTLEKINNGEFFAHGEEGEEEVDTNDNSLTILETNAKNIAGRIEVFTIESVFIGALAFSAFVGILSSDNVQQEILQLKNLPDLYYELINAFSSFQFDRSQELWGTLSSGVNLFGLLAIEMLVCSIFFILVLANKMRLANSIDKLNHIVNLANRYNSKEEEINYLSLQNIEGLEVRKKYLARKLDALITDGQHVYDQITPLYKLVSTLRSTGVYLFYLVLVTSGLFYSGWLSVLVVVVFLVIALIRYLINSSSVRMIDLIFEVNKPKGKADKVTEG
ncbi:MAG: hypothetical protein H6573_20600 [Lewinellaceae bacterium]|nr:hypothetical protein [Bacteroidota bacterium]MCB9349887.1 hypothetical protein [Lewinellaceae bacterium]